jgi:peptide/nickel transport system permease protein
MIAPNSPGLSLARVAIRAGLLLAAFVVALVVWGSVAARQADRALGSHMMTRAQVAALQHAVASRGFPAPNVGAALGPTLVPLVLALLLGAAAGMALAIFGAWADRPDAGQQGAGSVLEVVGRLAELPWVAISPFVPALVWVVLFGIGAGSVGVLEVLVAGGLIATLVANAAYDPLRRGDHVRAALAALGGAGCGVLVGIGALVVIEVAANRPGLGRLLMQTIIGAGFLTIGPIVVAMLVLGLAGSLLSLAGDAGRVRAAGEPPMERWPLATLALLGLPVLLLVISFGVAPGGVPRFDIAGAMAPPSPAHLLGTNQLGQDLLAVLMTGYRGSLGLALGSALLAVVVGGAWGAAAARVAARTWSGGVLADVLVAPGWVLATMPLLPAVVVLRAGLPDLAVAVAIGVGLLARLALAVRDLEPPDLTPATLVRAGAGVFLLCAGVAFVVGTGVDALGVGTPPPSPSLGRLLGDSAALVLQSGAGTVVWVALFSILTAGPCLFVAWTLLRPFNRGQAWGRLFG